MVESIRKKKLGHCVLLKGHTMNHWLNIPSLNCFNTMGSLQKADMKLLHLLSTSHTSGNTPNTLQGFTCILPCRLHETPLKEVLLLPPFDGSGTEAQRD